MESEALDASERERAEAQQSEEPAAIEGRKSYEIDQVKQYESFNESEIIEIVENQCENAELSQSEVAGAQLRQYETFIESSDTHQIVELENVEDHYDDYEAEASNETEPNGQSQAASSSEAEVAIDQHRNRDPICNGGLLPEPKVLAIDQNRKRHPVCNDGLLGLLPVPFAYPVINKQRFLIMPRVACLQKRLALQHQYRPHFPLNIKQLPNCGPYVKTPGFCLGDMGSRGSYGPRMGHDMRPFGSSMAHTGPSGSRMEHDVEPFQTSMEHMTHPGPNMDTPGMEVKEKEQPEVVEENKPEEEPVKSKPVIRISIPGTVWCVVQTNNGKHFFYNPTKCQSVWKMPEELTNRPDVEKLLSSKSEMKTEKEEQQSVQEEPPSKKFKSTFQHFADKNSMDNHFQMIDKMQDKESMCLDDISELAKQKQENAFIEEKVNDSKDSFTCFNAKRFKWTMELSEREKMMLYGSRIKEIHKKNQEILWSILEDMNLPLETVWDKKVRKQVQADPRYVNYTDGEEKRVADFALFMYKKKMEAKKECQKLLSKTELITSETKVMLQQEKEQPEVVEENKPEAMEEKSEAIEEKKSEDVVDKKLEVIEEKKSEDVVDKQLEVIEEKKSEPKPEEESVKSKPLIRISIPGTVWCVVQTNNGKHFFYNPTKRQSVWKMPEELKNRPDIEKLLSTKPEVAEKEERQNVQEEPPSKKFKAETEVREEKTNEGAQNIALGQETNVAKEVQATELRSTLSLEVRIQQFREMLAENNISAHSTWETELHKIEFDNRYLVLQSQDCKQVFEEYVKDRVKEEESKKIKEKTDLYRQLLEESNLNVKLKVDVKEGSNSKITQQIVLEKKTTNAVEVQAAENMPVLSLEDRKKKFKELLAENNVLTASTWEKELQKVEFDERYTLLTAQECKQAFEEYVKDRTEVKPKKRWNVNKNSKLYRFMQSLEESNLNVKLESEVKEEKKKSCSEATQKSVLEKETTNAVKLQTAENVRVVSLEDKKKQFKELLAENNVSTPTLERELPKLVNDKRYILLTSGERRQAFGEYMKDRCRQEKEHSELYRQLLEESDLSVTSTFRSFATMHSHDKRFRNIVNLNSRINMFQDYVSELAQQEKKMDRSIREKATFDDIKNKEEQDKSLHLSSLKENDKSEKSDGEEAVENFTKFTVEKVQNDFMKMLNETPGIDQHTLWRDVRRKLRLDYRYKAVGSKSLRKIWFIAYLMVENDVKGDFMKMLSEIPGINPSTSWGEVKNKMSSDPRYNAVSDTRQEEWFKTYLKSIKDVWIDFMKMLSKTPGIDEHTLWSDVRRKLFLDPRYKAVGNESVRENWFCAYMMAENDVKNDFMKMLNETPGIDQHTLWSDVRRKLYLDPRYKAVGSKSVRKNWFCAYMRAENDVKGDFMKMLSEIPDINPSTSWGDVKNKMSSDPRYKTVSDFQQQEWFKTYLKTIKDVKDDFMKMLSEIAGINLSTSWSDVKIIVSLDPRYKAVGDTRQEEWFKTYLKTVKKVKGDFMKMLSEIPGINPSTSWDDVKILVSSDPRYKAVCDTHQEEWFKTYLKTVKEATSDDIKNKEKQDKSLHSSSLKEKDESGKSHGEVAVEDNKKLLVKKVKNEFIQMLSETPRIDQHTLWREVRRKLNLDPRYKAVGSESLRKKWFCSYVWAEHDMKEDFMKLLSEIPDINPSTIWGDVKHKVSSDPRYKAVSDTRQEEWFKTYLKTVKDAASDDIKNKEEQDKSLHSFSLKEKDESRKSHGAAAIADNKKLLVKKVKNEFLKMLSETPGIDQHTLWSDVRRKLFLDPRYNVVGSESLRKKWFSSYMWAEHDVKEDFMKMLSEIPDINPSTIWGDVKHKVSSVPRFKAVSDTRQEEWFKTYLNTVKDMKDDIMKILSEIPGINPSTSWGYVKIIMSSDPRYKAVSDTRQEEWFKTYLKIVKEVKGDFMKMLSEIPDISPNTSWDDVKNKVSSDPRCKAVSDTHQEEWFKTYLKTVKEVKGDFMKMLSEISGINPSTSWADVKNKVGSDPRYKAVSDTHQEEWFKTYLNILMQMKDDFMKMLSEIIGINPSTSWGYVKIIVSSDPRYKAVSATHQEEWFKSYMKIVKEVKDNFMKMLGELPDINPSTSWDDVKNKVSSDPRCKAVSETHQEEWFKTFLKILKEVKGDFMKMLNEIPGINLSTSWDDVKNKVSSDPRFKVVSDTHQEEWFKTYLIILKEVKDNFMKMLNEIPGINLSTSWSNVKNIVSLDPRYKAVSDTHQEEWFMTYLNILKEVKGDFMKMLNEIPGINLSTSWDDVKNKVSSDPRFKAVSDTHQEEWFMTYLNILKEVKGDFMKMLSEIPDINPSTSWDDVKNKVCSDPRYKVVSDTHQEEWFKTYLIILKEVKGDFMKMLREIPGINPSTSWDDVKILVSYPRYKAVSDTHQEEWFKTYLKTVKEVKGDFMKMLSEIPGINPSTSWDDVKILVSSDPRYKAVSDTHQEEWFKTYLKTVKEVKGDFMKMLSEIPGINPSTSWDDVKILVSSDSRYKAVSDTHQEEWFKTYLKTVKEVTSDDMRKNIGCLNRRDAAFEDFKQFLVEKVKVTKYPFTTFKERFLKNPRWAVQLSETEKKELYDSHIYEMQKKNQEILWSVLEEIDLPLEAVWSEVKKQLNADPRFVNYTDSENQLADDYALFMDKKILKAKKEFQELLSEMELVITRTKVMLQQHSITMLDIAHVIMQDKRYTALNSLSEQREQMLLDYISEFREKHQTPK